MAGCLIRGRRRWSVTYTSPRGLRSSEFIIWNIRAFQERKPYQIPGWMKNSPYYIAPVGRELTTSRTPRLHNKQGVPHPTRSAIGRWYNVCKKISDVHVHSTKNMLHIRENEGSQTHSIDI